MRCAKRPRAEPLGGYGQDTLILGLDDGQRTMGCGPARRVGPSELLALLAVSSQAEA